MVPRSRPLFPVPARVSTALAIAGMLAIAFSLTTSHPSAQSAASTDFYVGKNVDVVGPFKTAAYNPPLGINPFFLGDPDKKQQNEPSCDMNPGNPLIIFCGMNDYRAVDRPDVSGDPWVGAGFSTDGGLSFKSHLVPGFEPDLTLAPNAPRPAVPPLGYSTAADPVVRIVPGLALYSFIAFNPDGNGALFLSRWYEHNVEGGFPYSYKDAIQVAKGTGSPGQPGRFLDKEAMAVSLVPNGTPYSFTTPSGTQQAPAAIVHMAYAVFTGNNQQDGTKIIYTRSTNYGDSWDPGTSLAESQSINQAADIAVDPATNRVMVVWRRFANGTKQPDAIMYALSADGGKSFSPPAPVAAPICPFTQGTTSYSFRTTTHPFVTFDGKTFHVVWADRGTVNGGCDANGYSRIVISDFGSNGKWSNSPKKIYDTTAPNTTTRIGHQFHPSILSVGTQVLVAWFDTRDDDLASTVDPNCANYVRDYLFPVAVTSPPSCAPDTTQSLRVRRRSADIWAAEAAWSSTVGGTLSFGTPKKVSRYLRGIFPNKGEIDLQRNNVNARMFKTGTVPFHGDYIALAAARSVLTNVSGTMKWVPAAGEPTAQPLFQLAWTDNRLVRGNVTKNLNDTTGSVYTPPNEPELDPTTFPRPVCNPATVGSRDQSVFSARVYPALLVGSASANKATYNSSGAAITRAFTVFVQNKSDGERRITLALTPVGSATGSFSATDATVTSLPRAGDVEDDGSTGAIRVPRRSSIARTLYVTSPSSNTHPTVQVTVTDQTNAGNQITTYINGNPFAAPLEDVPDVAGTITDTSVGTTELYTPDILYRATSTIATPSIDDPSIDDPSIDDPSIDDPSIDDPSIDDPSIDDPSIDDPSIDDPSIDDAAIPDSGVSSSNLKDTDANSGYTKNDGQITQVTWKIRLTGNTTTSMSTKVFVNAPQAVVDALNSGKSQLLISRRYLVNDIHKNTTGGGCKTVRVPNYQIIANVTNPQFTNVPTPPDRVNPNRSQTSVTIPPGGAVYLTVRIWGTLPAGFSGNNLGAVVQAQPNNPVAAPPLDTNVLPVVTTPGSQVLEATSAAGAPYTFVASASTVSGTGYINLATSCTTSPALGTALSVTANPDSTYSFSGTFPLGTTAVTCTASDTASPPNTGTSTFNVTVSDTTPPSLTVPASFSVEASGPSGAVATFSTSATDTVSAATVSCTPPSGSTFPLGTNTVSCTASDATGNTSAPKTFTVTVRDTTAPSLTVPTSFSVEATGPTGAGVTYSATATDTVSAATVTCTPASGSTFALGTTTVTCTAKDGAGNTSTAQSFTVTVQDTTAPTVTVPSPITAEAASAAGAVVTYTTSATDLVSGSIGATCSPASFTFPLGTTSVTCTASDTAGNTGSAAFTVTVRDTTAPVVSVPSNIAAEATGPSGAAVSFTASATDLVSGSVATTCTPASGSTFALGATTVTCQATDTAGNTGSSAFSVTVVDTTKPVLSLPSSMTVQSTTPAGGAVVTYTATATDLVSGSVAVTCTPGSGSTFAVGTTTVNCSATDAKGNTATGSFTVTVTPFVYAFKGLLFPWKSDGTTTSKLGATFQVVWQYANSQGTVIDSASAKPELLAYTAPGATTATACAQLTQAATPYPPSGPAIGAALKVVDDAGSSFFQYNSTSFTWQYNWKPSNSLTPGCYLIYVLRGSLSSPTQANGGFNIWLTK